MKKEYAEEVANRIIEQLEQGTAPWLKPWEPGELRLPYNAATGKEYRGMNTIWLHMQGYGDPRWMTYRQAEGMGAQVRKGSKGTKIVYWKFRDEQEARDAQGNPILDENGKPKKIQVELERPRSFTAVVFNAEQIDGLPPLEAKPLGAEPERHARAEAILANSGANINHIAGDRAYYQPATDKIVLPERNQFGTADRYYATALHELGHWTGHPSRLDRDLSHPFGSEGYAREELRAELASLMLGERLEIGHDPGQHAAYIGSWIKALKEDPREIFRAASDAEKITGYVMEFEREQVQEQQQEQPQQQAQAAPAPAMDAPTVSIFDEIGVAGSRIDAEWKNEAHAARAHTLVSFVQASLKDGNPEAAVEAVADLAKLERRNTHVRDFAQIAKQFGEQHGPRVAHRPPEKPMGDRTYLAVPYREKDEAKALGAKWDKEAKSWYAPPGVDLAASGLDRWQVDSPRTVAPTAGTKTPEQAFGDAIREAGLMLEGDPIMDGQIHRVAVAGDKGSERSGAYAGHLHGRKPGGYIENFKEGQRINWAFDGTVDGLSDEDRARQNAEAAAAQQRRTQARLEQQERTAAAAAALWEEAAPATPENPYCKAKGIDDPAAQGLRMVPESVSPKLDAMGIKIAKTAAEAKEMREANPEAWVFKTGDLLIAGRNIDGDILTLQSVNPYFKGFMKGSRKHGVYAVAGGGGEKERDYTADLYNGDRPFVVAEGFATANTVAKHLDQPVIVAFDSGNLNAVVGNLRERMPWAPILIAADNDHEAEGKLGADGRPRPNVGMEKAKEAAERHGAGVLAPQFGKGEKGSDWNDYETQHGADAAGKHLREQMAVAKLQAQQNAERLLTLARTREQEARNDPTTSADDVAFAKEQRKSSEMLTMATERLGEVRAEARDAQTSDRRTARPVAVASATTTRTNEQLREQVKTERQGVHNKPVDPSSREVPWKELPESVRQLKAAAVKAGRTVTLPKDAPAALRKAAGLDADAPRQRARARGGIDAGM